MASSTSSASASTLLPVSISTSVQHQHVPFGQEVEVVCMATLTAVNDDEIQILKAASSDKEVRAPVDIVAVLDRSGSMDSGGKLDLVKEAMHFVCTHLRETDRISIVVYDDAVQTIAPLQYVTAAAKENLDRMIDEIATGGSTNLSGGLFEGVSIAETAAAAAKTGQNRVGSVFLFTDGQANVGLRSLQEIKPVLYGMLKNGTSVMTFGFGSDHEAALLKGIAEVSKGLYYFLSKAEDIPVAFADCMGGLLSVVAQNISLSVETVDEDVEILRIMTKFSTQQLREKHAFKVTMQDIYAGESKNILVRVKLPKRSCSIQQDPVLNVSISYIDVLTPAQREQSVVLKVDRGDIMDAVNVAVDEQTNRFMVAEGLETANQLGDRGNLADAKDHLQKIKKHIMESASNQSPTTMELQNQIESIVSRMDSTRDYHDYASKAMCQIANEHAYERSAMSTVENDEAQSAQTSKKYVTKSKSAYRASAQAAAISAPPRPQQAPQQQYYQQSSFAVPNQLQMPMNQAPTPQQVPVAPPQSILSKSKTKTN
eukprot:ANDGO_07822.mRNA.1 Uncharacterized protein YfbK